MHVAALYANTNLDSEQNDRGAYIKRIDEYYVALERALGEDPEVTAREVERMREMERNDPFLSASRRNAARSVVPPSMPGGTEAW